MLPHSNSAEAVPPFSAFLPESQKIFWSLQPSLYQVSGKICLLRPCNAVPKAAEGYTQVFRAYKDGN